MERKTGTRTKRSLMETRVSLLGLGVLLVCFLLLLIYYVFFPRSTSSDLERRELTEFPEFSVQSYLDGSFTAGIMTFFTDTVPNRDAMTKLGSSIKGLFGVTAAGEGDVILLGNGNPNAAGNKGGGTGTQAGTPAQPSPAATPQPTPSIGVVLAGAGRFDGAGASKPPEHVDFTAQDPEELTNSGNVYIVKQNGHYRAMEYYYGGSGDTYVSALTDLLGMVPAGVQIWSMPTPIAGEFYAPPQIWDSGMMTSCSDTFDNIAAKMPAGIKSVNVCKALADHSGEDIYLRTDHHWQPLGAYYAAQEFALAAGVPFADISAYEKNVNEGYVGTMYGYTDMNPLISGDPDDFTWYVPKANYTADYYDPYFNYQYTDDLFAEVDLDNSYVMFLGGDSNVVKVNTEVKNGRTLMVLKDSYGNATIPFYTSSFEHIYVADVRYLGVNLPEFIRATGTTDVLFTLSAFSVVGDNATYIPSMLTQAAGSPIVDEAPDAAPVAAGGGSPAAGTADGGDEYVE